MKKLIPNKAATKPPFVGFRSCIKGRSKAASPLLKRLLKAVGHR